MEDNKEFESLVENQMELLLESDEEEASLIEEMERQAGSSSHLAQEMERDAGGSSHLLAQEMESDAGSLAEDSSEDMDNTKKSDWELVDMPKDIISYLESNENAASLLRDLESDEEREGEEEEEEPGLDDTGSDVLAGLHHHQSVIPSDILKSSELDYMNSSADDEQENVDKPICEELEALHKKVLQSLGSGDSSSSDAKDGESSVTEDSLDGVQILQLDMSARDLFLAKSAAAFRFHDSMFPSDKALTSEKLHKVTSVLDTAEKFSPSVVVDATQRQRDMIRKILDPGPKPPRKTSQLKKTAKNSRVSTANVKTTFSPVFRKLNAVAQKRKNPVEDSDRSSQTKKAKSDADSQSIVNFHCNYCNFRCPFTQESLEDIVDHLTPPERYHQLFKVPAKLKNFRENVKLNVMVAKNKCKALVRFLNRLECITCHQHFPLSIENGDQIVVHYHRCMKMYAEAKSFRCLFCNEPVSRGTIRKHLSHQCKKQCPINVPSTLQLMSCVCVKYAEDHKPVCVVCNEKCWPYLGHRAELDPVCEPCRVNIIGGNTTELLLRDVTGCAICSKYCSKKFVTYWASELESLFIGESCIEKLKDPITLHSEEIIKLKKDKIRKLVELAIASVNLPQNSEMMRLQDVLPGANTEAQSQFISSFNEKEVNVENNKTLVLDPYKIKSIRKVLPPAQWDEPRHQLPIKCTGDSGPLKGSFKILGSNLALPFTTITGRQENCNSKAIYAAQARIPGVGTYALLIPKAVSNKDEQKLIPNDNGVLKNNVRPGHFPLKAASLVNCAQKITIRYKDPPVFREAPKSTEGMKRIRIEAGGNVWSTSSMSQLNLNGGVIQVKTSTSTSDESSSPLQSPVTRVAESTIKQAKSKYVIKYVSYPDTVSKKDQGKEGTVGNENHIVIKTTSTTTLPKVNDIAPPRIAHVIRTQGNVFNSNWLKSEKPLKYRAIVPKKNLDTVTLD